MSIKNSKIFYVNSANRTSGTASDFTYTLDIPKNENFTHAVVLQASVPVTYYLVRQGINKFEVSETFLGIETIRQVEITPGNYSYVEFIDEAKTKINNIFPSTINYDVTYDPVLAKFEFLYSSSIVYDEVKFRFNSSLSLQFGFDQDKWYSFQGDKLVSQNVINFIPESIVNIHTDMIETHDGILQEMYSYNTTNFSNIVYTLSTHPTFYAKKLKTNHSNQFHFCLLDSDKNRLDTNGIPIIFTLLLYSISPFENNVQEYIKYKIQNS